MTINLFQTVQYRELMQSHIEQTITYLFSKDQEFAIACEVKHIQFNPTLPESIVETFNDTVLFVISAYSFETAKIDAGVFYFEAGFGEENFGATVTVPLLSIKQLFVGDHPIVLNLSEPEEKKKPSTINSMNALMNNPENKKLLKKKKL